MTKIVKKVKLALLLISLSWTVYVANAFIFLARAFPSERPATYSFTEFLASAQGYAVVFGPAIISAFFLMIRWPIKR